MSTKIEWTRGADGSAGETWNPVRGCEKISPGCKNCYAMRQAGRFSGPGKAYEGLVKLGKKGNGYQWTGDFREVPEALDIPLHWKAPQTIFVNSMSDLFGEGVSDGFIARVFDVMGKCERHTFQVLTKRAERMRTMLRNDKGWLAHPLENVWVGVSVEDNKHGVPRIDELRRTPAAIRFLSVEPLLEDIGEIDLAGIDWVIVGGESGNGARTCDIEWIRAIVRQCKSAKVPVFVKQLGAKAISGPFPSVTLKLFDSKGGDMSEWPDDLRIREMPAVRRVQ